MLKDSSPSKHNVMLSRHSNSRINATEGQEEKRPAKRIKLNHPEHEELEGRPSPTKHALAIPDSDADGDDEDLQQPSGNQKTDLESALPPISTDRAAIAAYETSHATEINTLSSEERLTTRKWVPGKSSIYVDAFNLALETVLEDESHLFDEVETKIFQCWRDLSYEAQYLYVPFSCSKIRVLVVS